MVERIQYYNCSSCGEEYEDEIEAEKCCPNYAIDGRLVYQCDDCGEEFDLESEATNCCSNNRVREPLTEEQTKLVVE